MIDPTEDRTQVIDRAVRTTMEPWDDRPITPESRFVEDLGMDSLDAVEFVMTLEDEFDVDIQDETAEGWRTLGDVYRWAEGL